MDIFLDLTDRFPMAFDVERMKAEVRDVQSDSLWLEHYDKALSTGWKAIPLVSHHGKIDGPESQRWGDVREFRRTAIVDQMPYFRSILDAFQCPQGRVRVLKLMPGAAIGMHRDIADEAAGFAYRKVRLHVPIQTNDKVTFHLGGSLIKMAPGRLYYCDFTQPHFVRNDGTEPRLHLVLDLVVNDFLAGVFPAETLADKVTHWAKRRVMPVLWAAQSARVDASRRFWRNYNDSPVQVMAHRVRGKRPVTPARGVVAEKVTVG